MKTKVKPLSLLTASLLSGFCLTSAANAEERAALPWEFSGSSYQGLYLYGQLGTARSDTSREEIQEGIQLIDEDVNVVSVKRGSPAWSLGAGYFIQNWLSAEVGYIQLGEKDLKLSQDAAFDDTEQKAVDTLYPQSGKGPSVGLVAHIPIYEELYLGAKVGAWYWEENASLSADETSGTDIWYGLEASYRLDDNLSIFAGWQGFEMPRQDVNLMSIGLRYLWGEQKPVVAAAPVPAPKPKDADKDGVTDSKDQCPDSPMAYAVDAKGCTLYNEEVLEYRLVIHYENDSSVIAPKYDAKLQELFEFMDEHNLKNIEVIGHTSAPASKAYNQRLSLRRAKSVVNELSQRYGVAKSQFVPIGKGESELLIQADTDEAHAQNRRTEVVVGKVVKKPVQR